MALRAQRNISLELSEKLAQAMKLTKRERNYFILMVQYTQESLLQQRHELLQQMFTIILSNNIRTVMPEQYEFYDHWYYAAIRELIGIVPVYESETQKIAELLNPPIKLREAQQALKVLERLRLIQKDSKRQYHKTDAVISCGDSIRSVAIRNFQRSMLDQAKCALDNVVRAERDFSTLTLSIDAPTWEQVKVKIAALRIELLDCASKVTSPDRVVQINFQGFPLTKLPNNTHGEKESR